MLEGKIRSDPSLSHVWLFATPWTVTHQDPLSMGFSRPEYWSELPFPSPMHACMLSCFSHVQLYATLWTAAHQALLSTGFSRQEYWSGLPVPSPHVHLVSSNHFILCHPLLLPSIFPSIRVFSNELALMSGGQSIGASASASVLPMNIQGWFPLGVTDLISKGLSRLFSSATARKHQFFGTQPSL